MQHLTEKIKQNKPLHGSIPFWSWNDKLKEDELRRQIRNMKALGMRGFFMHARGGLETEYMSDEWFKAVNVCVDEAERLGMEAWAYDENGWPSGFAGRELLNDPANFTCGLTCETVTDYPAPAEDILGVYEVTGEGVALCACDTGARSYTVIRRKRDFSYVDTMNIAVTRQFLEKTHERYRARVKKGAFGTVMPGFFTDEPQYFRYGTPWSDTFLTEYEPRFGYDVRLALPALFLQYKGAEGYRYDYRLFCHEKFYSDFMKPVYEWCDANGVMLTGHGIEEWGLAWQMMCCGGVMPFYLYEHIPGIDYLGRDVKNISGAKQLGSVCEQMGKKRALSEMFACCGWDVTPKELKRIADLQFAGGVNLICEHLYPYSERGQRKNDFPSHYSEHNPWQKEFAQFESHYANLGAALAEGREVASTLVLHPIRSAYLHYFDNDWSSLQDLDAAYDELVDHLAFDHIPYHFGDETILKLHGSVEGGTIRIGACVYDKVVIPTSHTVDANTAHMLREYLQNGGRLYLFGTCPDRIDGRRADLSFLKPNMTYEELRAASGISVSAPVYLQMRATDGGRLLFLANCSANEYRNTEITLADCRGLAELDIDNLRFRPVRGKQNADGSVTVWFDFGDSASCVLVESELPMLPFVCSKKEPAVRLPAIWQLAQLPENMMPLDCARLSKNGGAFTEPRPIVRIRDNLLREQFEGTVTLRFAFTAEVLPANALLVAEPMQGLAVTVNGKAAAYGAEWRIDRRFRTYPVASLLQLGANTVDVSFSYFQRQEVYDVLYGGGNESLRNCLSFDTEVESVWLFGDFGVRSCSDYRETDGGKCLRTNGPFALCARKDTVDLSCINKDGYVFFAGELQAHTSLQWQKGDPTRICLEGRFATVRAAVNGHDLGLNLFGNEFELAEHLQEGENTLSLTLCFSNRNLMGPHHTEKSEPKFVAPPTFSFEKMWDGGNCRRDGDGYTFCYDYAFVKFGILRRYQMK